MLESKLELNADRFLMKSINHADQLRKEFLY